MERTVPYTASEEVELYLRTYYSLLRSSSPVQIRTLEEVHSGMNSLLHPGARHTRPDMSAFIYSVLRLPDCISRANTIILGQSTKMFLREGLGNIENWQEVTAKARRRRCYFDGAGRLACIIASRSDIDDVVPILVAYQIEWNKFHLLLKKLPKDFAFDAIPENQEVFAVLAHTLNIPGEDLTRLSTIWGSQFVPNIQAIAARRQMLNVQLLNSSHIEYRRATNAWWSHIEQTAPNLLDRPLYFVSSNPHSIVNLLSGFALKHRERLVDFLENSQDTDLLQEWADIQEQNVPSSQENFFYYVLKKYLQTPAGQAFHHKRTRHEQTCGITRIDSSHYFDVDVQAIEIAKIQTDWIDPRLCENGSDILAHSDALILNVDYPLGLGAYNILSKVAEYSGEILGVYILGKAATLNGVIGDVMIPNVVHDEHSRNTFIYPNAFSAADVAPYLIYGTVLDNRITAAEHDDAVRNRSPCGAHFCKTLNTWTFSTAKVTPISKWKPGLTSLRSTKCTAPTVSRWTKLLTSTSCPSI